MMVGLTADQIADAFRLWSEGNQQAAVDLVRPAADGDDKAALALITWFLYQRGEPYWREGVPYAERAVAKGMPWIVNYFLGNMQGDPALRTRIPDLVRPAMQAGFQFDPVAQAYGPFTQGDRTTALRLMDVVNFPPAQPEAWEEFLTRIQQDFDALSISTADIAQRRDEAFSTIDAGVADVEARRADVQTRTQQLETLLSQVTNAEAQSFFDKEATNYEKEARSLWKWSIGVLAAAATFAVAPIAIYYLGVVTGEDWLADENLVAAHFAPAVALGAVAGVLLARARSRDRARQRARNLSVALGTMFVYSGQIEDLDQRQKFLHDMGRTVIEAFLRQDAPSSLSESTNLLGAVTSRS